MTNADQPAFPESIMVKIREDAEKAYRELQDRVGYTLFEGDFKLGFHEAAKKYLRQLETPKP